ncbi:MULTISPECIES: tyrosine-type recombinase/integrase [Rhodococcus]|uniref:tyrosine-type recombinase/integrase n=1 Tax=Rhodococcus TaxID=1827 RepID=UPI000AE9AC39|nr:MULTISPECIES: tyrosine-type recombinase/integrase [Rhodococcus]
MIGVGGGAALSLWTESGSPPVLTWREHLLSHIDTQWRPGEYDHRRLILIPSPDNPRTLLRRCWREGCFHVVDGVRLCPSCTAEHAVTSGQSLEEFCASPPIVRRDIRTCLVGCERTTRRTGLCYAHARHYQNSVHKHGADLGLMEWIELTRPTILEKTPSCAIPGCRYDQVTATLCSNHRTAAQCWLTTWNAAGRTPPADVNLWIQRSAEPIDEQTGRTMATLRAVPFGLLEEPLRFELVYALQLRDTDAKASLDPVHLRHMHHALRRGGVSTLIGSDPLQVAELTTSTRAVRVLAADCVRRIEAEHRVWSGRDDRDPRLIHFVDLDLTDHHRPGPKAVADLNGFTQNWIVESVAHWMWNTRTHTTTISRMLGAWRLADRVLSVHDKPPSRLSATDIDAIVRAITAKWPSATEQRRRMTMLWTLIEYGHRVDDLEHIWKNIPSRFGRNRTTHRPKPRSGTGRDDDEPFRFVPQPVVDWLMDHLHLVERDTDYRTMEARALLFLLERCGRRPVELLHLRDDCLSFDSSGHPFLEWERIKAPRSAGKRLPIHRETHDLIRQWQKVKSECGIESQWLFPSSRYRHRDDPYGTGYLLSRLRELVTAVLEHAPYPGRVEGAGGNLIDYDLRTIDAYALRHAYAQRYADAVDADGRSTTPPDVLQALMGHKSFTTTMMYYEVGAKRRKKALAAIPPRRIDSFGRVVDVNPERDGFTRVAVALGHCEEPQNVALGGDGCMLAHACEACPFFRVDPLERDGMIAKRVDLKVHLERASVIGTPQHMLDHYRARIDHCTNIINAIDDYLSTLPPEEGAAIRVALDSMADIRRRATSARRIDLRYHLKAVDQP